MCAYTPCFRREAGAAGKDTRGLIRVHQFDKVELVRLCRPEESEAEQERLTRHAETVLERLEIPYRRLALAAGDTGFASASTFDLEVWAAGVGTWLEASSASTFTDFQARRANIRFRREPGAKPEFVHTLNASGVAFPRTIIALLENNQQAGRLGAHPAGADSLPRHRPARAACVGAGCAGTHRRWWCSWSPCWRGFRRARAGSWSGTSAPIPTRSADCTPGSSPG